MKLSPWAKEQGIGYEAAWRMFRDGKLPVPAEQLPTGTIIVNPPKAEPTGVAVYALIVTHKCQPGPGGKLGHNEGEQTKALTDGQSPQR